MAGGWCTAGRARKWPIRPRDNFAASGFPGSQEKRGKNRRVLRVCAKTKSDFRAEFQHRATRHFKARQIRSPKSETRNKFKIRKLQGSKRRELAWFCDSDFGPSGLFPISSFGFRILGKVTIPLRNDSENPEGIFARALISNFTRGDGVWNLGIF